jgi:hypothetical protein
MYITYFIAYFFHFLGGAQRSRWSSFPPDISLEAKKRANPVTPTKSPRRARG